MEALVCLFGAFALPTLCFAAFHARSKGCGLALGCAGFALNAVLSVWYAAMLIPEIRREGAEIFGFSEPLPQHCPSALPRSGRRGLDGERPRASVLGGKEAVV